MAAQESPMADQPSNYMPIRYTRRAPMWPISGVPSESQYCAKERNGTAQLLSSL
jgi:hypothetical protein